MTTKAEVDAIVAYIDNTAGPVPSIISDNLALLEPLIVGNALGHAAWKNILAANLKIGTSPGEELTKPGVLVWLRQKVLALTVDAETPPVVTPPGPSAGRIIVYPGTDGRAPHVLPPLDVDGRYREFLAQPGVVYEASITGAASRLSMSCDNGGVIFGTSRGPAPGEYNHTGTKYDTFAAGDKIFVGIPATRAANRVTYDAIKFG